MNYTIKEIAHQLKTARIRKNLSQRALSNKIGTPQSHISKIEAGQVDLKFSSLVELARVLDLELTLIPREFILTVQGIIRQPNTTVEGITSKTIRKLNRIHTLSDKLANQHKEVNEFLRIGLLSEQLKNLPKVGQQFDELDKIYKQLNQLQMGIDDIALIKKIYLDLSKIRNNLTHNIDASDIVQRPRPAYNLNDNREEDDG